MMGKYMIFGMVPWFSECRAIDHFRSFNANCSGHTLCRFGLTIKLPKIYSEWPANIRSAIPSLAAEKASPRERNATIRTVAAREDDQRLRLHGTERQAGPLPSSGGCLVRGAGADRSRSGRTHRRHPFTGCNAKSPRHCSATRKTVPTAPVTQWNPYARMP